MKKNLSQPVPLFLASLSLGLGQAASAHVSYTDLSDPVASPGGVNGGSFSNSGWFAGTTTTLGDSHSLAGGTFFKFHLTQDSFVTIVFGDSSGTGTLNPAFSVYRGLLGDDAHDDAAFDPLNPSHLVTVPPPPHVVKDPSPVDDGVTADAFGRVSPFRDTVNITFTGQFDALHTWSMANPSGDWAVVQYVAHAPPQGGNSVSLVNLLLPDGDYTIAAAGGTNCTAHPPCMTNIDGTISFSATVAPDGDGDAVANGLDNCPATSNPNQQNGDSDALGDACDNCRLVANNDPGTVPNSAAVLKAQLDADHDGYGNFCDADINQSNGTTVADYTRLRNVLNRAYNYNADSAAADLNGSGTVTTADYTLLRNRLNTAPGPSGLSCAGTIPCP